jgi:hypothetical protein
MRFENGQAVQFTLDDHSVKLQPSQIADGPTMIYSENAHVGGSDSVDETDTEDTDRTVSTASLGSVLLTSMCSDDTVETGETERMTSSAKCVPDEVVGMCFNCEAQFTLLRRRHQCRACGRACCAECAPRSCNGLFNLMLKRTNTVTNKRVCMDCAKETNSSQAQPSAGDPITVKNTFFDFKRSPSVEDLVKRIFDDTSFPY